MTQLAFIAHKPQLQAAACCCIAQESVCVLVAASNYSPSFANSDVAGLHAELSIILWLAADSSWDRYNHSTDQSNQLITSNLVASSWLWLKQVQQMNHNQKCNLQASVDGGVSVPVFVDEEDLSFGALVKQATALGMGGWWLGGGHMKPNPQFLNNVRQQIPVDGAKVIVACQKGLR